MEITHTIQFDFQTHLVHIGTVVRKCTPVRYNKHCWQAYGMVFAIGSMLHLVEKSSRTVRTEVPTGM